MGRKEKNILILCMLAIIIGTIMINKNSSDIVKKNSNIEICNEDRPKIILKLNEKQLVFKSDFFYDLQNGFELIFNNIKENIN